jgi:tetratricopeptide (TPR) repeat protein
MAPASKPDSLPQSTQIEAPQPPDRRARKLIARIQKSHQDHEAVSELTAHYAKLGDYASLANLQAGFAETLGEGRAASDAFVAAADAALMVHDRERALRLYERALTADPLHSEALDRALRIHEADADAEAMAALLRRVLQACEAARVARRHLAGLRYRLGLVHENRLHDPVGAAQLYRAAVSDNPHWTGAIAAARRLAVASGDDATVRELFEAEIEVVVPYEDKRMLLFALADYERARADLDGALRAIRRAYKLTPGDIPSLARLVDLLVARSEREESSEAAEDRKRAAEVLYQMSRAVPRADALPLLRRALGLDPEHPRLQTLYDELCAYQVPGSAGSDLLFGTESQSTLDERATRVMPAIPDWPDDARTGAYAPAERTGELSTEELLSIGTGAFPGFEMQQIAPPDLAPAAMAPAPDSGARAVALFATPSAAGEARLVSMLASEPPRLELEVNLGATTETNLYVDLSNRLRAGGVFIATYQALTPGTAVALHIHLPGDFEVRAHGRVALQRLSLAPFDDPAPALCVAFEALTSDGLALLERFARNRTPLLIEPA